MASVAFKVAGMSCGHCVAAVSKAVNGVTGVKEAKVEIGSALVEYDPSQVNVASLSEAIENAGYDVAETSQS